MKTAVRLSAALLLLTYAASVAQATWMGPCAHGDAAADHSHSTPADGGPYGSHPAPADGCPLPLASHAGCGAVCLPSAQDPAEFQFSLQSQEPISPAEEYVLLWARDRFHPPRR